VADNDDKRGKKIDIPTIPPRGSGWPEPPHDPNPVVARCGKCGLELHRVMGYFCPHADCPCGLGPTTCKTGDL